MSVKQEKRKRTVSCVPQVTLNYLLIPVKHLIVALYVSIDFLLSIKLLSLVTTERPVQVKVVKVKKSDKGDFYKRQMAWELRDLTKVDAKDANKVRGHNVTLSVKSRLKFLNLIKR